MAPERFDLTTRRRSEHSPDGRQFHAQWCGRSLHVGLLAINGRDRWGKMARERLATFNFEPAPAWYALLRRLSVEHLGDWHDIASPLVEAVGEAAFCHFAVECLDTICKLPREAASRLFYNTRFTEGLAYCCVLIHEEAVVRALAAAAEHCYIRVPGMSALSPTAGDACISALAEIPTEQSVMALQRLLQRVKHPSAQARIERAVQSAADRLGVDRADLDDMAVPGYDLRDGRLLMPFGDHSAEIVVEGARPVSVRWLNSDGSARRSRPAVVERVFPDAGRTVARIAKDIGKVLIAQRDRIERLMLDERVWPLRLWRERYLDHPLVSVLARRLIWSFGEPGEARAGAWSNGVIVGADGGALGSLEEQTPVRLWHPMTATVDAVLAWREWVERQGAPQPFKQAHREIYLLTVAEQVTRIYSNRFAAHILRHYQFNALCEQRGWQYALPRGSTPAPTARRNLSVWGIWAEFSIGQPSGMDFQHYLSGAVAMYAATDQVRFYRMGHDGPLPLDQIPPLVFSEVMREVDLFVGVASVGNDPTWQDGGPDGRYQDYWQGYAFGDLSATAQTRRAVLERLLPRLAIAERCTLAGRFLTVRGDRRTYKIHLGSGNILMEPNDQYLCIVPGRGAAGDFDPTAPSLPFEGDRMFSVILSKALLLANDRAITDPTILRQLG